MTRAPMWKDGETPKKRRARRRRKLVAGERKQKDDVRDRDRVCRFPLCGCQKSRDALKNFATVSHDKHKGIGGDPTGKRSIAELMILLCKWRHQDAAFSIHAQTIRNHYLTLDGNNGPIEWHIKRAALAKLFAGAWPADVARVVDAGDSEWIVLARETKPQLLEPLEPWQRTILERLERFDL